MKKAVILHAGEDKNDIRGQIFNIYTKNVLSKIESMVDLFPQVITYKTLDQYSDVLSKVEIAFSAQGMFRMSEAEIEKYLPNLRILFYGAGSVRYFARAFINRNITVVSGWKASGQPVIEYTASIIQLSLKGMLPVLRLTRDNWRKGRELADNYPGAFTGVTVGIIGVGMIGKGVLKKLRELDIAVQAFDPYCTADVIESFGAYMQDDLMKMFSVSQVISNHMSNLSSNKEMLRYEHFMAMPGYATFINTGRNSQVHVQGLVKALHERSDLTAYLDVTDPDEPTSPDNPLLTCDNLFLTPHIAGSMGFELGRQGLLMAEECERWLSGQQVQYGVTAKLLETMA